MVRLRFCELTEALRISQRRNGLCESAIVAFILTFWKDFDSFYANVGHLKAAQKA